MRKAKQLIPGLTEKQVTEQVVAVASAYGVKLNRRNTGGMSNSHGQYVAFGTPGDSDFYAVLPSGPHRGKVLCLEVKKEGFNPRKLRGAKRTHFDRQLARLKETNGCGGFALWISDSLDFQKVLAKILTTPHIKIVFDGDYPYVETED